MFHLHAPFAPSGDQPQAIEQLVQGVREGRKAQVLLGITGSGKTFTMANVIAAVNRPALILAHNKTLAAQLYQEFKFFFPKNAVEYFVSYYDYYQPEAYIPRTDTYIEKDLAINDAIDRMRHSATRSLIERRDVIIVSSVSCIYGLGMPEFYCKMVMKLKVGDSVRRDELLMRLVQMHYKRSDMELSRATFRARGDVLEIMPAYEENLALRIELFGDELERISEIDPLTGRVLRRKEECAIFPGSHHVTPASVRENAIMTIKSELAERMEQLEREKNHLALERIRQRTRYDLEMIQQVGFCKGIENYSRHFSQRSAGDPPPCLLDYFPPDFLFFVDESHQTMPQLHAMYNGDQARKKVLVEFGFRLPSALDNRPLKFDEVMTRVDQVLYISATPGQWEIREAGGKAVEQLLRPTGLLDPIIEVRPAAGQVDDCLDELRREAEKGNRILVTTLTKKLSEDLTKYLCEIGVRAKYMHSDIDTLERMEIIKQLRQGSFDVLVGINLLREGLDIPEVSLVAILDADKEGFLRSETALIQTCGRAARNVEGRVILYADSETEAIRATLAITASRRAKQQAYNKEHGIIPKTVRGREIETIQETFGEAPEKPIVACEEPLTTHLTREELEQRIRRCEAEMKRAAKELRFEEAALLRDQLRHLEQIELFDAQ